MVTYSRYCIALLHEQKSTLQVPYSFNEFKNEGVRLHTHLKGLIMVPYKLPNAILYLKHSPLKSPSNNL